VGRLGGEFAPEKFRDATDQRKEMNANRDELVAGVVDVRALALKSGGGCAG
jgi:hypothetical protein